LHNEEVSLGNNLTLNTGTNLPVKTDSYSKPIPVEESLSLLDKEKEMIIKALEKHKGKRKYAAEELGISERTLYRKINEYHIEE
jgi:transcriptional regulator with PAS, ATPase and Fis domain